MLMLIDRTIQSLSKYLIIVLSWKRIRERENKNRKDYKGNKIVGLIQA